MTKFKTLSKRQIEELIEEAWLGEDEAEALRLMAKGMSRVQMSMCMGLSERTIDRRIKTIKTKINNIGK